jgi:cobyrinic acid a,c-diamide synthase
MTVPGLLVAAPASGSGKTTVALGLMRAFVRQGLAVQAFKAGPDYIDPAFHRAATGRASFNLDTWSMPDAMVGGLIGAAGGTDLVVAEGAMGLYDGVARPGASGRGTAAEVARRAGWPVVLVLDCGGQGQTAGAVALGCARYPGAPEVAGVVLNRIASPRHARLARAGVEGAGLPCFGALPRRPDLTLPERHLGLVQAGEHADLEARLEALAEFVGEHLDLQAIRAAAAAAPAAGAPAQAPRQPPGQRIALAQDAAFSFVYPHLLAGWRAAGAEVVFFSPLADEAPDPAADVVWLPGGYPELHAGRLSAAGRFRAGLARHAEARPVHGECGGYMALGAGLVDAEGRRHAMAGLLGLETSFAARRLHLGYRRAELAGPIPGHATGAVLLGHEFHHATILAQPDAPLARVTDADGTEVSETGARRGHVTGSFFHLIAAAP